jgi:hypothetical protein
VFQRITRLLPNSSEAGYSWSIAKRQVHEYGTTMEQLGEIAADDMQIAKPVEVYFVGADENLRFRFGAEVGTVIVEHRPARPGGPGLGRVAECSSKLGLR